MGESERKEWLPKEPFHIEDQELSEAVFSYEVKLRKARELSEVERAVLEEYNELSKYLGLSELQSPLSVRTTLFAKRLALLLIDEMGEIRETRLSQTISLLKQNLYALGPGRGQDSIRREHALKILELLKEDKEFRSLLMKVDRPHQNRWIDEMIRETLLIPKEKPITDASARRAVLSALLTYLRQSVGSCFATAPAILIQREQPKQLLKDLIELMGTGCLKRTFEGVEYAVPLSYSWGAGDLRRKVLIGRDLEGAGAKVWLSPGLINAFESVGLIDRALPIQTKRKELRSLIQKVIEGETDPCFYLSPEEILAKVLMLHHRTDREEIQEFQNRPIGMVQSGFLLQPSTGEHTSSGQRVLSYFRDYEEATKAFRALADNALLKAWEFTIASFTETKSNFSKWNLFVSLGLGAHDKGGLGERLFHWIEGKLQEENLRSKDLYDKYEQVHTELRFMDGRLRRARDDTEMRWLRAQYQTLQNEFRTYEEMLSKHRWRAESFANLFDVVVHFYLDFFPRYFQEIYDADMHQTAMNSYDDSPAGFQLIFKHGRQNPSAWTPIKTLGEYVDALVSFFKMTETEIVHDPVMKGFGDDLVEMVSILIAHVRTEEFLESAFVRMALRQGGRLPEKPLEHLDQIEKKPWSYTSGGNLETLIQCYFKLREPPRHADRWMENPTELLLYIVDVLKELPPKELDAFRKDPGKLLLMTSPTHAFLLKPGLSPLQSAWESPDFTYTWCRDKIIEPIREFVERQKFDREMSLFLLDRMKRNLPQELKVYFEEAFREIPAHLSTEEFRNFVMGTLKKTAPLAGLFRYFWSEEEVDALLYRHLPLGRRYQFKMRLESALTRLGFPELLEKGEEIFAASQNKEVFSAKGLINVLESLLLQKLGESFANEPWHEKIRNTLRDLGFLMPKPLLFADTNWLQDWFGLTVNPGTGHFELWRLDPSGTTGFPMASWRRWLNGTERTPQWEIFQKPYEYQMT